MTTIRLNPSSATLATLERRVVYGGRKGRAAARRLGRQTRILGRLVSDLRRDFDAYTETTADGFSRLHLEDTEHRA